MSLMYFGIENGYLDGIVRGYKKELLLPHDYTHLTQCETIEDFRLQISATAYGPLVQNLATLTPAGLHDCCLQKLVSEFRYLQTQAAGSLARFLEYITFSYMIDNVILLITGTLHGRDTQELLERCHPLGMFDALPALSAASSVAELYNMVLIETPLEPYFRECFEARDLDEMNIEIIRNMLYKAYLSDFYKFCQALDPTTKELMSDLLDFEADRRTLSITVNSFDTELSKDDRVRLFPQLGRLYPEATSVLGRADDLTQVKAVCENFAQYRYLFDAETRLGRPQSLEDALFVHEARCNEKTFLQQMNYAVFYSYLKLREQEIRNLVWIAECICQQQKERINDYIPLFDF